MIFCHATGQNLVLRTNQATENQHKNRVHKI